MVDAKKKIIAIISKFTEGLKKSKNETEILNITTTFLYDIELITHNTILTFSIYFIK